MSQADVQYLQIVQNILNHGYYANNRTGVPTYKLPHQIMQFDLAKEFPILTTKFVASKRLSKKFSGFGNFKAMTYENYRK